MLLHNTESTYLMGNAYKVYKIIRGGRVVVKIRERALLMR
jgi:hypothetical protein